IILAGCGKDRHEVVAPTPDFWERLGGPPTYGFVAIGSNTSGGTLFLSTGANRVFRSTDGGATWTQASVGLDAALDPGNFEGLMFAAKGNPIYAVSNGAGVFRSTDDGHTWSAANTGIGNLDCRAFVARNALLVGTSSGVFRSLDDGERWSAVTS